MSIRQDQTFAGRSLRRSPLLTLAAVVSLAVGIAGTATVFSLADALLFRASAGLSQPGRLVDVGRTEGGSDFRSLSYPNYKDYRDRNRVLRGLAAYRGGGTAFGLTIDGGALRVVGGQVSANYFEVLGTPMALGRGFLPAEERDATPVTVISHALWRDQFQADRSAVGRTVVLNGRPFTVVGVTGEAFTGYGVIHNDVWVPLTSYVEDDAGSLTRRAGGWLMGVGRLEDGVTLAQARTNLRTIAEGLEREFPSDNRGRGVSVAATSLVPQSARGAVGAFLAVLFTLVTLVLLIACMNVGGMLAAHGATKSREMAVRLALGAGRYRLLRLLATEGVVLATLGSILGTAGAWGLVGVLEQLVPVLPLDIAVDLRVDWRVVALSLLVAVAAGGACGVAPALQSTRLDLTAALKSDSAAGGRRLRVRKVFVVAQVAFTVLLVVCAALLVRSVRMATTIDPGFVTDGVDVATVDLRLAGYDNATGPAFAAALLARVEQLPGVEAATSTSVVPLTMRSNSKGVLWRPEQHGQRDTAIDADWNIVAPRYFETIGTPIVRGRSFSSADGGQSPDVVIVNETLAARVWPGEDPVGRLLTYGESDRRTLQVVGVARDAKYLTLGEASQPFIYVPLAQHYDPEMSLLLKRTGPSTIPALRALLRDVNPNLPLSRASTLEEATAFGLIPNRLAAWMASVTGLVGALLAALGMYGVTAHYVSQRRREIGIRIALGGLPAHVIRLVVGQGAVLGGIGMVVGVGLAGGASTLLAALLFAVQPLDAVSFGIGVLLSVIVTIGASLVPALAAASVNPVEALRQD